MSLTKCQEAILQLEKCHRDHPIRRFFGICNDAKAALDKCFSDEYLVRRELNAEKARQDQERLRRNSPFVDSSQTRG